MWFGTSGGGTGFQGRIGAPMNRWRNIQDNHGTCDPPGGDPSAVIAGMRSELHGMERALLIDQVQTMSQRIEDSAALRRLNLVLFGLFAAPRWCLPRWDSMS